MALCTLNGFLKSALPYTGCYRASELQHDTQSVPDTQVTMNVVQPHELAASMLSVGAVQWDGAFAMVAYLGTFQRHSLQSALPHLSTSRPGLSF